MKTPAMSGCCVLLAVLSSGCRCACLDNASGDFIDTISEPRLKFDCWYFPELDLTRIGKPDWCRSPFNRLLCRDKCNNACGQACRSRGCSTNSGCESCGCKLISQTGCNPPDDSEAEQIPSTQQQSPPDAPRPLFEEIPPPKPETEAMPMP